MRSFLRLVVVCDAGDGAGLKMEVVEVSASHWPGAGLEFGPPVCMLVYACRSTVFDIFASCTFLLLESMRITC